MPVQRPLGHPEDRRGLIHRQAGEIAQKDDLGLERVADFEFLERLVDREYVVRGRVQNSAARVQRPAAPAATARRSDVPSSLFDQDVSHGACCGEEEVLPAFPGHIAVTGNPQVRLVDQGGGLEGFARSLVGQLLCGQFSQLVVDQRQEICNCLSVPGLRRLEHCVRLGVA
jgi:hypothetical protein